MSTVPVTGWGEARRTRLVKASRVLAALSLIALAIVLVYGAAAYRWFEASVAATIVRPFVDGRAGSFADVFWIISRSFSGAFQITDECTAIILIVPMLVLGSVLIAWTRAGTWRVFAGVAASYLIITLANEIRLALIGWSSYQFGMDRGYPIMHTFVGSVIAILGFAAGLGALVMISVRPRRRASAADKEHRLTGRRRR